MEGISSSDLEKQRETERYSALLRNEVIRGNYEEMERLLRGGFPIDTTSPSSGYNALTEAILKGDQVVVEYLLENGANVNYVNQFGETPIFHTCKHSRIGPSIVRFLISSGADASIKDIWGDSLLNKLFASVDLRPEDKTEEMAVLFIEGGADASSNGYCGDHWPSYGLYDHIRGTGRTPLMSALLSASSLYPAKVVTTILNGMRRQNPSMPTLDEIDFTEGCTVLHAAIVGKNIRHVELLLLEGADYRIKDALGRDAVQIAQFCVKNATKRRNANEVGYTMRRYRDRGAYDQILTLLGSVEYTIQHIFKKRAIAMGEHIPAHYPEDGGRVESQIRRLPAGLLTHIVGFSEAPYMTLSDDERVVRDIATAQLRRRKMYGQMA
jgi:hypothetical protein